MNPYYLIDNGERTLGLKIKHGGRKLKYELGELRWKIFMNSAERMRKKYDGKEEELGDKLRHYAYYFDAGKCMCFDFPELGIVYKKSTPSELIKKIRFKFDFINKRKFELIKKAYYTKKGVEWKLRHFSSKPWTSDFYHPQPKIKLRGEYHPLELLKKLMG